MEKGSLILTAKAKVLIQDRYLVIKTQIKFLDLQTVSQAIVFAHLIKLWWLENQPHKLFSQMIAAIEFDLFGYKQLPILPRIKSWKDISIKLLHNPSIFTMNSIFKRLLNFKYKINKNNNNLWIRK